MRAGLVVALTSAIASVADSLYEFFFAPDLYDAGPPLARFLFGVVLMFPFILVALLVIGVPISLALHRVGMGGYLPHLLAGAGFGLLVGYLLGFQGAYGFIASAVYGAICAILWRWSKNWAAFGTPLSN